MYIIRSVYEHDIDNIIWLTSLNCAHLLKQPTGNNRPNRRFHGRPQTRLAVENSQKHEKTTSTTEAVDNRGGATTHSLLFVLNL